MLVFTGLGRPIVIVRVLFLTSAFPPLGYSGHDERCRQTLRALAQRGGALIQLLTSDYRLPPMGMAGEQGFFRELRLHPENTSGGAVLGQSFKATYAHELYNAGVLSDRLLRFRPDVVYVWNMHGLSKSLLFQIQAKGVPLVFDLHSDWLLPESFNQDPWYRWWLNNSSLRSRLYQGGSRLLGRARRILQALPIDHSTALDIQGSYVVSECLRNELVGAGLLQAGRLPVIYPGLDLGKIQPKTEFKLKKRFLWAGRLNEAKGPDLAVEAVGLLKARGIDVRLDLFGLGEPSERKAKRARIEGLGLIDRVRMWGIRPGELAAHYAKYDAILYTNREAEPFSMTVLEAMLSRLPLIAARIGGNLELIEHERNAYLFEPGSAEALADALVGFMDLPDRGKQMACEGYESLRTRHSHLEVCASLESILRKAQGAALSIAS
ncbi:MAG: glycosyltransferase family 1 protein [Puniceicoccaceae bacterium]|nr:MAG: glycosyltransferase family 1 protein [Puniceicoccaceae bacterium]